MKYLDVSIVIVNWNTCDILRDCLCSVFEQTHGVSFEVIVIDNCSSDGSSAMVRQEFPHVILTENAENRGFAAANNQALKISKGRYVLLLNSDTVILDNAITKTVTFADSHPDVAVVGCRVLNPDKTLQFTCFMFPSLLNMFLSSTYLYKVFPGSKFFGREQMTWWNRSDAREVDVVTGCFMLVRREAIEQVGMMDEQYFMYAEETDWCYRFRQAGWKLLFTPDAQIIHLGGQSSKQIRVKSIIQLRLGLLQFFFKNKNSLVFWLSGFLILLFFLLRIPLWLLMSIAKPADRENRNRLKAYLSGCYKVIIATVVPKLENFKA